VIPTPKGKENKKKFISRCIKFLKSEGKPKDQAAAICYTKWEKGNVKTRKLFERIDRIIGEEGSHLDKVRLSKGRGQEIAQIIERLKKRLRDAEKKVVFSDKEKKEKKEQIAYLKRTLKGNISKLKTMRSSIGGGDTRKALKARARQEEKDRKK